MATVKIDFVIKKMQENEWKYFRVFSGADEIDRQDDENTSLEEAINQLTETVDSVDTGMIKIMISGRNMKEKGTGGAVQGLTYYVKAGDKNGGTSILPATRIGDSNVIMGLMEKISDLRLENERTKNQQQLEGLQRQIDEIKNGKKPKKEDGMFGIDFDHPIAGKMVDYLGFAIAKEYDLIPDEMTLDGFHRRGTSPALNGNPAAPETTEAKKALSDDEKQRIAICLKKLSSVPQLNLVQAMELLATYAELDPSGLLNGITMIQLTVENLKKKHEG